MAEDSTVSLDAFTLFPGLPACEGLTLDLLPSTRSGTETADVPSTALQDPLQDAEEEETP